MRITTIVVLALIFLVGCENPAQTERNHVLYQGQIVQTETAPFLLNNQGLAKVSDGTAIIEETTADGTVYGLQDESEVYAAEGGEVLPKDTWIDNQDGEAIEVSLTAGLVITFEQLATVTIVEAVNISYISESGQKVLFSGSGVITTTQISTGEEGSVTLISNTKFGIGSDGGDNG
ncbi:MAG: hypothetical protein U9Q77_03080 [Candidatus Marinimicrobia bacterium]|nr:hypothetical protein [Candidatus Neomarinimicrobiota bacterium]